jgi:hypothetical protein
VALRPPLRQLGPRLQEFVPVLRLGGRGTHFHSLTQALESYFTELITTIDHDLGDR